jgi:hypothetical protein
MCQPNVTERGIDEMTSRFNAQTRPDHAKRLDQLRQELASSVFVVSCASETARFGVLGCLNAQLAFAQKLRLKPDAIERGLNLPFSLGYIFGAAAWHIDRYQVTRPGPDADSLKRAPKWM